MFGRVSRGEKAVGLSTINGCLALQLEVSAAVPGEVEHSATVNQLKLGIKRHGLSAPMAHSSERGYKNRGRDLGAVRSGTGQKDADNVSRSSRGGSNLREALEETTRAY